MISGERDVSDHDRLSEITAPFRHVIDTLPVAVCICNTSGAITTYNQQAVTMWGRTPELEGTHTPERYCGSLRLSHPNGTPLLHSDCPMAEVLESGTSILDREVVIERPDGTYITALARVAPICDDSGALVGAINCFQDITALKQTEEALLQESTRGDHARTQLERLASFPELNPNPVVETNLLGRLCYMNPEARREFPDLEAASSTHPLLHDIPAHFGVGGVETLHMVDEVTVEDKVYERRACFFPHGGRIIIYATDLTARKHAADALAASERRFRTLLEQAADAIYVIDQHGRFLDGNQRACESTGYTRDELHTMGVWDIDPNWSANVLRETWANVSRGESVTIEAENKRKDGTIFPVELSVGGLELEGRKVMVALTRDITVRRRLEAELRQAQRLEAIGHLAGGIAHDFNNLLTVILGSADLLLDAWPPTVSGREDAEEIRKAALRAAALTQQLLAFSRRQVLRPAVLDLNTVVTDMATMLQRLIGENIELTTTLEEDLWSIRADQGQLEQVITNLAVNARDAMQHGGVLTLETGNQTVGPTDGVPLPETESGQYVTLAIRDTGSGMGPEVQSHLFEPFFTTKSKDRGTGFGLATVYGIVAQSGGHIAVESKEGQGSTFTIYLPRVETPNLAGEGGPTNHRAHGGSETILIAEDEKGVRSLIQRVLVAQGYTVLAAGDGAGALALGTQYHGTVDLLLSDVVMPGMSGRELAEQLLRVSPQTKVAFLSGYTDDEILRHGVLDAQFTFLQKPISPDQLGQKVREILDAPTPGEGRGRPEPAR